LVDLGLTESRNRAQSLIRAGEVLVNDCRIDKPGTMVPVDANLRISSGSSDVSRGAEKLRSALLQFNILIEGRTTADLGASTGGFTQVLLEKGATCVHAFDVGYGQLHERLRTDPRVVVHDRTNVRYLSGSEIDRVDVVVMDLSFIGLELVLPSALAIAAVDADFVALVKPQFEAGKELVGKGGVVRDEASLYSVLDKHLSTLKENGCACWALVASILKGKKGNQEFLSWFRRVEDYGKPEIEPDISKVVAGA